MIECLYRKNKAYKKQKILNYTKHIRDKYFLVLFLTQCILEVERMKISLKFGVYLAFEAENH